jgi:hypothetical protein
MRDIKDVINSRTKRRWKVTTASGEWVWAGTPKEIINQMASIEHPGGTGATYMERVKNRVQVAHGLTLNFQTYGQFLRELEREDFIFIEVLPIKKGE